MRDPFSIPLAFRVLGKILGFDSGCKRIPESQLLFLYGFIEEENIHTLKLCIEMVRLHFKRQVIVIFNSKKI